jgi:hypothetical protein
MMNTFTLIYGLASEVPENLQEQILKANTDMLTKRGMTCQRGYTCADILYATDEWDDFPCINAAFDFPIFGLELRKMLAVFDETLLPWPPRHEAQHHDGGQYRDGECVFTPYAIKHPRIKCVVRCRRDIKTVEVSTGIGERKIDEYRTAMIDTLFRVKKVARATKATQQLIQAYRSSNPGFVDRSTKELFEAIGSAL